MRTFKQEEFKVNELIQRIYGVICAHHTVSDSTAKTLVQNIHDPYRCVTEEEFATFGEESENPMYVSYEVDTWIHPDYDRSSFDPTSTDHAVQFGYTVTSITFYESQQEKLKRAEELRSEALLILAMNIGINSQN